jgi:hypothetical protein
MESGSPGVTMTLYEWFDPSDKEHLRAFQVLNETGTWPKGFVPEDIDRGSPWRIAFKIADYYVSKVLEDEPYEP